MNIEDLKKEMPYKWRVQSANEYGASCVAYIDARDVQDKLDEVVGAENWSVSYKEIKGNLFCTIGIKSETVETFKTDCGTESNIEKQKGESSDAFKRAAVMWGVGRFLYHKPIIKLDAIQNKQGKWMASFEGKILYGDEVTRACNFKLNKG